jgi:hypothetical protein
MNWARRPFARAPHPACCLAKSFTAGPLIHSMREKQPRRVARPEVPRAGRYTSV